MSVTHDTPLSTLLLLLLLRFTMVQASEINVPEKAYCQATGCKSNCSASLMPRIESPANTFLLLPLLSLTSSPLGSEEEEEDICYGTENARQLTHGPSAVVRNCLSLSFFLISLKTVSDPIWKNI